MTYSVYEAGPMTRIPAFNFPLFFDAAKWLRNVQGWFVRSPAEKDLDLVPWDKMQEVPGFADGDLQLYIANSPFTMENAMEWDLPAIMASDGIVMLPGWEKSTGARWERTVAEALGRDIWLMTPAEWRDAPRLAEYAASPFEGPHTITRAYSIVPDPRPKQLTEYLAGFPNVGAEVGHA